MSGDKKRPDRAHIASGLIPREGRPPIRIGRPSDHRLPPSVVHPSRADPWGDHSQRDSRFPLVAELASLLSLMFPQFQLLPHLYRSHPCRTFRPAELAIIVVAVVPAMSIMLPLVVVIVVLPVPPTTLPVAGIVTVRVVTRCHPIRADTRRQGPVASVPDVARADRIPVARDPCVVGIRARRPVNDHRWGRRREVRRPDANSN